MIKRIVKFFQGHASSETPVATAALGSQLSPRTISHSTKTSAAEPSPQPVYLGFDTSDYPGDTLMKAWLHGTPKQNPPFYFVGFYLAPTNSGHRTDTSWMAQRANIATIGYGFGIFYIGAYVTDLTGLTAAQCTQKGQADGTDAVQLASTGTKAKAGAGFTKGVIYFDREHPEDVPTANEYLYLQAWISVVNNGNFQAGIYCSRTIAATLHSNLTGIARWWIAGTLHGPNCSTSVTGLTPKKSGISFADNWQYGLGNGNGCTNQNWNGQPPTGTVTVDLDMSFYTNPSNT